MSAPIIDIDALLGEQDTKTLRYKKTDFTLPAEMPGVVLAPFLNPDLGLSQIFADFLEAEGKPEEEEAWIDVITRAIRSQPALPLDVLAAGTQAMTALFDAEKAGQARKFFGLKPSVNAYLAILVRVVTEYGMDFAGFFGSSSSSPADGTDSKPTSPASTESTPAGSGPNPATPAS